ncbi:MAG: MBL fold metallo-hydrolase [Chloroflexota bacterium]
MPSEAVKVRNSANWFDIEPLAPGLFGIGEFGYCEEVISFLILGANSALLIDTGTGFFSMRDAVHSLTQLPTSVINTHSHFDHVGSNFEFEKVALFDHPDNRRVAEHGFTEEYLAKWSTNERFLDHPPDDKCSPYRIRSFKHARYFEDDEVVEALFPSLFAFHTPGHSDDSVCFFDRERGWLFSGDLLYNGPIFIERTGGLAKFRRSIAKITTLEGLTHIWSSHNDFEFSLDSLRVVERALEEISSEDLEEEVSLGGRLRLVPS